MKKVFIFLILVSILIAGCGYKIVGTPSLTGIVEEIIMAEGTRSQWSYFIFSTEKKDYLLNTFHWMSGNKPGINPQLSKDDLKELIDREVTIKGKIQKTPQSSWSDFLPESELLIEEIL